MKPVLIAGLGNIFHGDDGFGVEVARVLAQRRLPAGIDVVDFGIRGLDLAYALTGGCRFAVLVDTVQRGEAPGTLYLIEPEVAVDGDAEPISPHRADPACVLRLTSLLGSEPARTLLVGCEPASFGPPDEGCMALSDPVAAAVDEAAAMAISLAGDWLRNSGLAAVGAAFQEAGDEESTSHHRTDR